MSQQELGVSRRRFLRTSSGVLGALFLSTGCGKQAETVAKAIEAATPIPEPPLAPEATSTPEPTSTPLPEPTRPPEPTRVPERFFQEVGILDVYTSDLFIVTKGKIGNILIARLPNDNILIAYNTLSPRTDGRKPTPIVMIQKTAVRGGGLQFENPDEKVTILLQGPSLGGQIQFKNLPGISEPALFSATPKGNGSQELFQRISAAHNPIDPRITPERVKDLVTTLYQGPLEPSK